MSFLTEICLTNIIRNKIQFFPVSSKYLTIIQCNLINFSGNLLGLTITKFKLKEDFYCLTRDYAPPDLWSLITLTDLTPY